MPAAESAFAFPEVALIGDLASHTMLIREHGKDDSANTQDAPYRRYRRGPEEPLLPDMIRQALLQGHDIPDDTVKRAVLPNYAASSLEKLLSTCSERISVLDLFPSGASARRGAKSRLRVRQEYLAAPESSVTRLSPGDISSLFGSLLSAVVSQEPSAPRILVIYDQDAFTRQAILNCREDSAEWLNLRKIVKSASGGIIIGINGDLFENGWLGKLIDLLKLDDVSSSGEAKSARRPNVIIQISADCLRKAGLNITKYGALEETIGDIFKGLDKPPLKELLSLAMHVVVVFRETGSLHIDQSAADSIAGELHFCPNFDRIAQSDETTYGNVPGKFAIFIVSLVKELYRVACNPGGTALSWRIADALRLGAVAYNVLFSDGLRQTQGRPSPFLAIEKALSKERIEKMRKGSEDLEQREYLVCSLDLKQPELSGWSRTSKFLANANQGELQDLYKIVERGLDDTLVIKDQSDETAENGEKVPWFPRNCISVPYASFKKLKLLDSAEIAKYYSLAKIIRKYIQTATWTTPLSIAVFGPPGSGKSFGVKQILETVDPGRKTEPLTFNLAQFSSVEQLTDAFHQIQDRALSSDEVPLAIFDEFDAHFLTWRGWLKYFLAPMQDGLFRGRNGDYRVGRAIFLFSGGTSDSYEEFVKAPSPPGEGNPADALRIAKVSDFASRLRGYLDIVDINEPPASLDALQTAQIGISPAVKLRRAVILRSLLVQHAEPIFVSYSNGVKRARIHPTLIAAFLNQKRYLHGVRSMEAIIQMSRWVDGEFVPASLPLSTQLKNVHVEGDFLFSAQ